MKLNSSEDMAAILEYFQFKVAEKLVWCVFLIQRELDAANMSAATTPAR